MLDSNRQHLVVCFMHQELVPMFHVRNRDGEVVTCARRSRKWLVQDQRRSVGMLLNLFFLPLLFSEMEDGNGFGK